MMLKIIGTFLAKKALPVIAANIDIDIDTVVKAEGVFYRIRVEAFGFTLSDRLVKVSDKAPVDSPIDVFHSERAKSLPEGMKSVLTSKKLTDLKLNN